jgi:hypothetical protein
MKKNKLIFFTIVGTLLVLGTTLILYFFFSPLSLSPLKLKSYPSHKKDLPISLTTVKSASNYVKRNPPVNPPVQKKSPKISTKKNRGNPEKTKPKSAELIFGVDTANAYTPQESQCVAKTYEKPKVVGRYLQTKKGFFSGLTKKEVLFVHKKGAKILPIYNHYTNFIGAEQGKRSAKEAITKANRLGIPKGKLIVIDIEPKRQVNSDFFISWTLALQKSGYKAGIYGNVADPKLKSIYLEARQKSPSMKAVLIWTNSPNEGTLHKPTSFKGKSPDLKNTLVWQYGVDQSCQIDSDLVKSNLLKSLW